MGKVGMWAVLRPGGTVEIREVILRQESLSSTHHHVDLLRYHNLGIEDRLCVVEDHGNNLGG